MQTHTRSSAAACLILLLVGRPAQAQTLQELMGRLFIFGDRTVPLQVSAQVAPSEAAGGIEEDDGFQPSAVRANGDVLRLLTRWVGAGPSYFPVISTSGGVTFTFQGGLPEATAISAGPIFAEQGRTLGGGRAVVGARYTSTRFTTMRGKPIEDLRLNFTHANIDNNQCDKQEGRDCAALGVPLSENDVIQVLLTLDLKVDVAFLFASYGLSDWLELGFVVPVVHTSLDAHSLAQILPFDTPPTGASHFIAGTPESPVLSSTQVARGSATGIGDLAGRLKLSLLDRRRAAVAVLAELRAPTGDDQDFLGSGKWEARGLGILSLHFGSFAPHLNAGYVRRGGNSGRRVGVDAALATVGFDASIAPWVTFAADLLSELQLGRSEFRIPPPVTFTVPSVRSVRPIDITDARDNQVSVSLGFKFATLSSFKGVANSLIPITGKGPHPGFAWTLGVEYEF
jgi:hypothetical protein